MCEPGLSHGVEHYAQVRCHSERSEESVVFAVVSCDGHHMETRVEILRCAQNDRRLGGCASPTSPTGWSTTHKSGVILSAAKNLSFSLLSPATGTTWKREWRFFAALRMTGA